MILLLTVVDVQPRIVVVDHGLLPQDQKEEEEMIPDPSRGLHVGEWTEIIGLQCRRRRRRLVMDEIIGLITIIVVRIVNETGILLLPRVGRLCLHRLLVGGTDGGTDLHRRISRDEMHPCMIGERRMYVVVVEEEVGIGIERGIEDMNVVVAKGYMSTSRHPLKLTFDLTAAT